MAEDERVEGERVEDDVPNDISFDEMLMMLFRMQDDDEEDSELEEETQENITD